MSSLVPADDRTLLRQDLLSFPETQYIIYYRSLESQVRSVSTITALVNY